MRIIQGSHRGRKLQSEEVEDLRPMRAQVRAALFNILDARSARVPGSRFLDLFAGTGSVGIEALSRGAAQAVFVDLSREAVRLIQDNLTALQLSERAVVYHEDAIKALAQLERERQRFDLVFIGPPYGKNLAERALTALAETHLLDEDALVITEIFKKETLEEAYGHLRRYDTRRYGDNLLIFYRWLPGCNEQASIESSEARQRLERGIALYNAGEFFECHEVLEELWRADSSEYRDLYQGLIKAAVAFYHVQRGNFAGARKVLQSGLRQLRPYLNRQRPLELDSFVTGLERALLEIERCGRTGTSPDRCLIPRWLWKTSELKKSGH